MGALMFNFAAIKDTTAVDVDVPEVYDAPDGTRRSRTVKQRVYGCLVTPQGQGTVRLVNGALRSDEGSYLYGPHSKVWAAGRSITVVDTGEQYRLANVADWPTHTVIRLQPVANPPGGTG